MGSSNHPKRGIIIYGRRKPQSTIEQGIRRDRQTISHEGIRPYSHSFYLTMASDYNYIHDVGLLNQSPTIMSKGSRE
jgi:hypothetical protein